LKDKYKQAYIDMAVRFGQTSECKRLKVGALLVKDNSVISIGVNGMPEGWETETCEEDKGEYEIIDDHKISILSTKPECRHAEVAALEKLWNRTETARGASLFVSVAPCNGCAIKLVTAGIEEVYYRHTYRYDDGLEYLAQKGVTIERI
jgi:dCMP deaminase